MSPHIRHPAPTPQLRVTAPRKQGEARSPRSTRKDDVIVRGAPPIPQPAPHWAGLVLADLAKSVVRNVGLSHAEPDSAAFETQILPHQRCNTDFRERPNAFNCPETQHQVLTNYLKTVLETPHNSQAKSHQMKPEPASHERVPAELSYRRCFYVSSTKCPRPHK